MPDDPFVPPVEPPPPDTPSAWRRVLGLALDVLIVLIVLESWELPVAELAGGLIDSNAPLVGGAPTGPSGFGLSGRGGQIIGLGATGLALALQLPFAWRASTLGLSLFGLEVRSAGRRAPPYLSAPWTIAAWTVSIGGLVALIVGAAAMTEIGANGNTLGLALGAAALVGANLFAAMRTGRSLLDRAMGVELAFRATPEEEPDTDHTTGWKPRPDFVAPEPRSVDKDLHAWRTHSSADPLAPIWGPDPGPMLESPEDPEHVDHVPADSPFAAVGSNIDTTEDLSLALRLREVLEGDEPDTDEA